MPRCAGAPAQLASNETPAAAANPPRNLRRPIPMRSSVIIGVALKQCELRTVIALHGRRLESRRHRRAVPLAGIESVPLARNLEALAEQFREFAGAHHAAAEFR